MVNKDNTHCGGKNRLSIACAVSVAGKTSPTVVVAGGPARSAGPEDHVWHWTHMSGEQLKLGMVPYVSTAGRDENTIVILHINTRTYYKWQYQQ